MCLPRYVFRANHHLRYNLRHIYLDSRKLHPAFRHISFKESPNNALITKNSGCFKFRKKDLFKIKAVQNFLGPKFKSAQNLQRPHNILKIFFTTCFIIIGLQYS